MKKLIYLFVIFISVSCFSQTNKQDSIQIKKFYNTSLLNGKSYQWLTHLTKDIGGRLSGSDNAQKAVEWSKNELEKNYPRSK